MKKIILVLFFLLILSALTYYGYPIFKSRYFSSESKSITADTPEQKNENFFQDKNNDESETKSESASLKVTVAPSDCDNGCTNFIKNDELEYCKEICGLSALEKTEQPDNCENQMGIKKDYCFKDLAVKNKDFRLCDPISDEGVKKACKNRITEDIMDTEQNSPE